MHHGNKEAVQMHWAPGLRSKYSRYIRQAYGEPFRIYVKVLWKGIK